MGFEAVETFNIKAQDSTVKAAGAGAIDMVTQLSEKNTLKIGRWKLQKMPLILFNLTHVNTALTTHKAKPVDGIIGADVLKQAKAVIDYETNHVYLMP